MASNITPDFLDYLRAMGGQMTPTPAMGNTPVMPSQTTINASDILDNIDRINSLQEMANMNRLQTIQNAKKNTLFEPTSSQRVNAGNTSEPNQQNALLQFLQSQQVPVSAVAENQSRIYGDQPPIMYQNTGQPNADGFANLLQMLSGGVGSVTSRIGESVKPLTDTIGSQLNFIDPNTGQTSPLFDALRIMGAGYAPSAEKPLETMVEQAQKTQDAKTKPLNDFLSKQAEYALANSPTAIADALTKSQAATGESIKKYIDKYKSTGEDDRSLLKSTSTANKDASIGDAEHRAQIQFDLWQKKQMLVDTNKNFNDTTIKEIDTNKVFLDNESQLEAINKAQEILNGNRPFDAQVLVTAIGRASGEKGNMSDKDAARYVPPGISAGVSRAWNSWLGSKGIISKENKIQLQSLIDAMRTAISDNQSEFVSGRINILAKKGFDKSKLIDVYGDYIKDKGVPQRNINPVRILSIKEII